MAENIKARVGGNIARHKERVIWVNETKEWAQRTIGNARLGIQLLETKDSYLNSYICAGVNAKVRQGKSESERYVHLQLAQKGVFLKIFFKEKNLKTCSHLHQWSRCPCQRWWARL